MNMKTSPVTFAAKSTFFYNDNKTITKENNSRAENLYALHTILKFANPSKLSKDAFIPSNNMSKMGKELSNLTEIGQNKDTGAIEITRTVTLLDDLVLGRQTVLSDDDFKTDTDKSLFKSVVEYIEECKKQVTEKLVNGEQIVASEDLKNQFGIILTKIEETFKQVLGKNS